MNFLYHHVDHLFIGVAVLLALWADRDAGHAQRAAVIAYLTAVDRWSPAYELRQLFGVGVESVLRKLERDGAVLAEVTPPQTVQGGPPTQFYRVKHGKSVRLGTALS